VVYIQGRGRSHYVVTSYRLDDPGSFPGSILVFSVFLFVFSIVFFTYVFFHVFSVFFLYFLFRNVHVPVLYLCICTVLYCGCSCTLAL
jgi:hypothetical protein